jgi:Uma2 family endonuclease
MAQPKPSYPEADLVQPVALGRPPTYADIEALPAHLRGEIVNGQLYVLPRPRVWHGKVATRLTTLLDGPFGLGRDGPGGWWFVAEPELHLDGKGRPIDPDLAGWRRERLPELPDTAAMEQAPDWVCEVLSPSTEAYDRGPKMETYGRHGVPRAWLVDPEERVLEAYGNDAGVWRPLGRWQGGGRVRIAPFDSIVLDLNELWS